MEIFAIILLFINLFILLKMFESISKRMNNIEKNLRDLNFFNETGLKPSEVDEIYEEVVKEVNKLT